MELNPIDCEILGTGPVIVGRGIRAFDAVLRELIERAKFEILLAIYMITPSALDILDLLEIKLRNDIVVKLVVNRFKQLDERVKYRMLDIASTYDEFYLMDFNPPKNEGEMHAKVMVFDREIAIVGSTNLSLRGLVSGHEIAVHVSGIPARHIGDAIDRLMLDWRTERRGVHGI
jgi:phosphatidylserine/phosphatidylglycerophosphate/cardiolipin synthase-like enzyme